MNLKLSKILRKESYGDLSLRGDRTYTKLANGMVVNTGARKDYQMNKRAVRRLGKVQ